MYSKEQMEMDVSAKMVATVTDKKWQNIYRVSIVLKNDVKIDLLQQALDLLVVRFPFLLFTYESGYAWHRFAPIENSKLIVEKGDENYAPCRNFKKNGNIVRIVVCGNRVHMEVLHILMDGAACFYIFNSMLAKYFTLCGETIEKYDNCTPLDTTPDPEEFEDSFVKYATSKEKFTRSTKWAFKVRSPKISKKIGYYSNYHLKIDELSRIAKRFDATVSEFISAVMLSATLRQQASEDFKDKRHVSLQVPLNLRPFFETKSLRNFSLYFHIHLEEGKFDYTFRELLNLVKENYKEYLTEDYLRASLTKNYNDEQNIFVRNAPMAIKKPFMRLGYHLCGDPCESLAYTNLGKIKTPNEFNAFVERYEVMLCPPRYNNMIFSSVGYKNSIVITAISRAKETVLEKEFYNILRYEFGLYCEKEWFDVTQYQRVAAELPLLVERKSPRYL